MKPHKHAAIIKAWADGAIIEYKLFNDHPWEEIASPSWDVDIEYRIKPRPKPDAIYYGAFGSVDGAYLPSGFTTIHNPSIDQIKLTFDCETGKLKAAEVLK